MGFMVEKNKVGRPSKYKPEFCEKIIEWGKDGASKAEMACNMGIHKETLNEWDKTYPEFSDSLKMAVQHSQVAWEKIGKQAVAGAIPNYNATTWIFNMKNRFSDDYKDVIKQETQPLGKDGLPTDQPVMNIFVNGVKSDGHKD